MPFVMTLVGLAVATVLTYVTAGPVQPATFLPVGVLAVALMFAPPARWPIYALAGAVVTAGAMIPFVGPGAALVKSAIAVAEGAAVAWLLRRFASPAFSTANMAHAFRLILIAAGVCAIGGFAGAFVGGRLTLPDWRSWWLMDALGVLLALPAMLGLREWWRRPATQRSASRVLEFVLALAGAAAVVHVVFGGPGGSPIGVPAYVLPFLFWPAFRTGPGGTAAIVWVIGTVGIWHTTQGRGPYVFNVSAADAMLRSQATISMVAVSCLLLASVIAERARALAEIRTLRGFIPICAWCHKVRDDEGFWQRLETYLGNNTDAEFSHSICPSCSDTQQHAVDPRGPAAPWKI